MISALLGLASALSLGGADFMARFSSRALGAPLTYGAVLLVGAVGATIWLFATGAELVWSPLGCAIAVAHGVSVSVMCILLYLGIARGPIAVVVPIVASSSRSGAGRECVDGRAAELGPMGRDGHRHGRKHFHRAQRRIRWQSL